MEQIPDHPMIRRLEAAGTIRSEGFGRREPFALTRVPPRAGRAGAPRRASPAAAERPG